MSEWIIDARGGTCPHCEQAFDTLALHWARNQRCTYPELDDSHHETIRGCLLGDGGLDNPNDGPPALRIASVRRPHLTWLHGQLGWLSRGITRDSTGAYRLRTMSHPAFIRYWSWMDGPPASDWTLSRPVARVWYACDGGLEWPGESTQPRAQWTITDDSVRATMQRMLSEVGFEPMEWQRRIALPFDDTAAFLEWLGDPPPGSEYKWTLNRPEYDQLRTKVVED